MRMCVTTVLVIFVACEWSRAEAPGLKSPERCLVDLQARQAADHDSFVLQGDLDPIIRPGGGGACATAAVIDAIQVLRVMAGQEPISNPDRATLELISGQDHLLNGRVTDSQFRDAIEKASSRHLSEWGVRVDVQPSPHGPLATSGEPWAAHTGPDLSTAHGQLKIVTYTVTTKEGSTLGRHFVLVKTLEEG